jgi:hypothetical protein
MRRKRSKKPSQKLNFKIRSVALQLPKHIRDNITHPLLRLAWLAELNSSSSSRRVEALS